MRAKTGSHLIFSCLFIAAGFGISSSAHAALIGNDPIEGGGWDLGSDGHNVLSLQLQNPVTQAGTFDSFTLFSGGPPGGFNQPFEAHAMVLRPTGTPNQYTVIFDSGALTQAAGYGDGTVHTVAISPLAVQPGDVVGHWGRLVGFDNNTAGEDTWFYNGGEFLTPLPSGIFTAPGASYSLGGGGTREYAIAFNEAVPEPSAAGLLGIFGVACLRRRRNRAN